MPIETRPERDHLVIATSLQRGLRDRGKVRQAYFVLMATTVVLWEVLRITTTLPSPMVFANMCTIHTIVAPAVDSVALAVLGKQRSLLTLRLGKNSTWLKGPVLWRTVTCRPPPSPS